MRTHILRPLAVGAAVLAVAVLLLGRAQGAVERKDGEPGEP